MKIHTLLPVLSIAATVLTFLVTAVVRRRSASTLSVLLVLGAVLLPSVADLYVLHLRELSRIAFSLRLGFAGEFVAACAVLLFSYLYGRQRPLEELRKAGPLLGLVAIGALFVCDLFLTQPDLVRLLLVPPAQVLLIGNAALSAASFFLSGIFLLSFFQMGKTYSAASGIERWNLKYPLIGVGLWSGSVLAIHANALANGGFDRSFLYLGEVGLLLMDGFFLYAYLIQRPPEVALALSRSVLNRSLLFLLGGVGIALLGGMADVLGVLGPLWGRLAFSLALLVGAGAFVVVFSSARLRRELEEFLGVHFYSSRYDYRQAWMTLTRSLSEAEGPEKLLPVLMEQTREIAQAQTLTYGALEEGSPVLTLRETLGWSAPRNRRRIDLSPSLLSSLSDGLPRLDSREGDPAVAPLFAALNATWILPLVFKKRPIGLLGLGMKSRPVTVFEDRLFLQALSVQWTSLLVGASASREAAERREAELLSGLRAFTFHDLKNVGAGLRLLVHNARRNMEDPEFREELLFSLESLSKQMDRSMEQLLSPYHHDYARLSDFSPGERVREVVRGLAWDASPSLSLTLIPAPELLVRGNPRAFDTTLRNLLLNAREILEEQKGRNGPGEIKVEIREEGEAVAVAVSDNGPGMSREFIETRLFRPFQTTKKKGTGLGLFSCRLLLEQSGGRIGVASREGEGTEFWITYPRGNPESPPENLPEM